MDTFLSQYEKYRAQFEEYAQSYAQSLHTSPVLLGESMEYSLLLGGKRIRPVLALATADALGVPAREILPFALAIEMIHTYSLIHDDLPSMDNDDFRRGKPSNHKVYGEANAILAGDGLLNQAYFICLEQCSKGETYLCAAKLINECAGIFGMIAGQSADLYFSEQNKSFTEKDLAYIYEHKTGKLILAPIATASILADNRSYASLETFGKLIGALFQLTDDILDEIGEFEKLGKSIGKDKEENKLTSVKVYGLEGAKIKADFCASDCHAALEGVDGNVGFLHDLVDYIRNRSH